MDTRAHVSAVIFRLHGSAQISSLCSGGEPQHLSVMFFVMSLLPSFFTFSCPVFFAFLASTSSFPLSVLLAHRAGIVLGVHWVLCLTRDTMPAFLFRFFFPWEFLLRPPPPHPPPHYFSVAPSLPHCGVHSSWLSFFFTILCTFSLALYYILFCKIYFFVHLLRPCVTHVSTPFLLSL